jgi:uncharacterized membrane protein YheB (UPF0754 family)
VGQGITWVNMLSSAVLGAFIGWITNVMTIRLLFHPRRPIRLGPIQFQGVIPRRRDDIAASLAGTVTRELLTARELWERIDTPANREALIRGVRRALAERFRRLPAFPFKEAALARVEEVVIKELLAYVDGLARRPNWADEVLRRVPLEDIIVDKIRSYDLEEFERLIIGLSRRELRQIELLGGLLGFVVGLFLPLLQALAHW